MRRCPHCHKLFEYENDEHEYFSCKDCGTFYKCDYCDELTNNGGMIDGRYYPYMCFHCQNEEFVFDKNE